MSLLRCTAILALAAVTLPTTAFDGRGRERIDARLKGFQEVPAVSTAASGRFKATLDPASASIAYELSYSGLEGTVTMAHIHLGQHGVNGGIMVWLCQTATNPDPTALAPSCPASGSVSGLIQAANVVGPSGQGVAVQEFAEMVTALRAGVAYVNVHSSKFPAGEIRGQVKDD